MHEARGENERAVELYRTALLHSKTEIHALLRLADRAFGDGDAKSGLYYVDLILRRWPGAVPQAFGIVVAAAGDAAGREVLADALGSVPPWRPTGRPRVDQGRQRDPPGAGAADREGPAEDPARRGEIESTVAALASSGAVRAAQALHLATLPSEGAGQGGLRL